MGFFPCMKLVALFLTVGVISVGLRSEGSLCEIKLSILTWGFLQSTAGYQALRDPGRGSSGRFGTWPRTGQIPHQSSEDSLGHPPVQVEWGTKEISVPLH